MPIFDAFISYSSANRFEAVELGEQLRADGFTVWLDVWNIPPGGDIYSHVMSGVIASRFLLQLLSPKGLGSEWAAAERAVLLIDDPQNRQGRYVPLLMESVPIPPDLRRFRYLDWRSDRDQAYRELHNLLSASPRTDHDSAMPPTTSVAKTAAVFHGGAAPISPPRLVGRGQDLDIVRGAILDVPPTGVRVAAIQGWPGVGKTVVASTVAHDPVISERFPDGVLWATVGENPDFAAILHLWALARGLRARRSDSLDVLQVSLREHLSDRRVLVVLDDVWLPETSKLMVSGPRGFTLITTRSPHIARVFADSQQSIHQLGVLAPKDSLALLASKAPQAVKSHRAMSIELMTQLEHLPLAIKVAGHLLQAQAVVDSTSGLEGLFAELRDRRLLLESAPPSDIPHPASSISDTVAALFITSVSRLTKEIRDRFLSLAVLAPAPAIFTQDHASALMVVRGRELLRTLTALYDGGLIEPVADSQYWIHSMFVATAKWMR